MKNLLIIEDEQNSAERLKRLIKERFKEYRIVAIVKSNAEVCNFFKNQSSNIDLILSDIQLGDGASFESLSNISNSIPIIFITAYNHYAVQAFKFNSVDYLLKPIDADELFVALNKFEQKNISTTQSIAQLLTALNEKVLHYRERFLIPYKGDEYIIIQTTEVSHIHIKDGIVRIYTMSGKEYCINMSLDDIETQLDPRYFMRVNRQFIINASAVEKLSNYFLGKMRIYISNYPSVEIYVSKDKVASVKKWLNS